MEYTTKGIEERMQNVQRIVTQNSAFVDAGIKENIKRHGHDILKLYHRLSLSYGSYAKCYLLTNNDTQKFKGYCFLAAKAGSVVLKLYDKGLRSNDAFIKKLDTRKNVDFYIQYAILANCPEMAVSFPTRDSAWRCVLEQKYDEALEYLPEKVKSEKFTSYVDEILWAIVHKNEKKMNQYLGKRIMMLRRQARAAAPTEFDSYGMALIKLAKARGLTCDLNVRELPQHLLDDIPVNEEEWHLPQIPTVDKILAGLE